MRVVHLRGRGPNPHWNVYMALEILQGLQNSGILLLRHLDKLLEYRKHPDPKRRKHPDAIGTAEAATVMVAHGVEIAIKTLYAQTNPDSKPPKGRRGHDLLVLLNSLDQEVIEKVEFKLKTLPAIGGSKWLEKDPNLRRIVEIGANNFTDWRYLPEPKQEPFGGGVPKGLINVMQALKAVCLDYVTAQERSTQ